MASIPGKKFMASNMWHGKRVTVTVECLSWSRICKWEQMIEFTELGTVDK